MLESRRAIRSLWLHIVPSLRLGRSSKRQLGIPTQAVPKTSSNNHAPDQKIIAEALAVSNEGYYSHPTINGDLLVFVCEDDLWSVSASGGVARRLTSSSGDCWSPRLSPDGKQLAFVSKEEGHPEVFVMPASGGQAKRLTYLGSEICYISSWSADGKEIIFCSDAKSPFLRHGEFFSIKSTGSDPSPLNLGHGLSISMGKKSGKVIGRNAIDPARWKRYRGGTAGELWIDPDGKGRYQPLLSLAGNLVTPMWIGNRIYFLSDHKGVGNIFSCRPDGNDLRQHTKHTEYYVRFPSTDGDSIVYSAGAKIYRLGCANDKIEEVKIQAPSTCPQSARKFVGAEDHLEHVSIHPKGHAIGLISRGQPLTMSFFEGPVIQHGQGNQVRYRHLEWLADGERFLVVNDRNGYERIELHWADQSKEAECLTKEEIGRVINLKVSPTMDYAAVSNQRHELLLLNLKTGKLQLIDHSPADRITGLNWSADGSWLAYSWACRQDTRIIRIVEAATRKIHDVTDALRQDDEPVFDPEGQYLYFLSNRDFNPVYDSQQFELSFPMSKRPYLVTLRKDVVSPFAPCEKPFIKSQEKNNGQTQATALTTNKKQSGKNKAHEAKIEIDFDDITKRIIGFPLEEGIYIGLTAINKRIFYTSYPVKGIPREFNWLNDGDFTGSLLAYDFDEQRSAPFLSGVIDYRIAHDNKTLVYRTAQKKLRVVDASQPLTSNQNPADPSAKPGRSNGWLDVSRANLLIEPSREWSQMFAEAWRLQKEHFWDEKMSDIDWDLVFERYTPLLKLIRTRTELSDLIWEMQGELGTSHAYEFGGDLRRPRPYQKGFLGADLFFDQKAGGYRIKTIWRGDSWDNNSDSPLAEPGLNIDEDDLIISVNGCPVSADLSVDELLLKSGGQFVQLLLKKGSKVRQITIKALRNERYLRYRNWVEKNRSFVHEQSKGKLGYLHIPDMGPAGFAEFHRGYLSEVHRDGLIVDVRYNRGGHVSPLLLEKLARKRVGYDISRWGEAMPYPTESIAGPLVAVTNQFAGSDGDIFSHCFKLYDLGPLVGKRTWGGVIGIWPRHALVDGTVTTQPEFSFWFKDVGWDVENYGTDPDFEVDITPHDYAKNRDPQLEKAVDLALEELSSNPVQKPSFKNRPSLALPGTKKR